MPTIFPASGRERRPSLDGLSDGSGRELADRELLEEGTDCVLVGLGPGGPMMEHPPANSPAATTNTTQMAARCQTDRAAQPSRAAFAARLTRSGTATPVPVPRASATCEEADDRRFERQPDQHRDESREQKQIQSPYDASPGDQGLGDDGAENVVGSFADHH